MHSAEVGPREQRGDTPAWYNTEKFKLLYLHVSEDCQDEKGMKNKCHGNTLSQEIAARVASNPNRAFEIEFADKDDDGRWTPFQSDTQLFELLDPPKFRLLYLTRKETFHHAVFLTDGGSGGQGVKMKNFGASYTLNGPAQSFSLRDPQKEALLKLRNVLHPALPSSRFMVILPTGCGKTVVMAMAPFMLDAKKVLFILPDLTIRDQVLKEMSKYYSAEHPIGDRCKQRPPSVRGFDPRGPVLSSDAVVTNIQALVDNKRTRVKSIDAANPDDEEEDVVSNIRKIASEMLGELKPDVVIVDEGHHFPASSWDAVSAAACLANPKCKFVLLTATPARGDAQTYNLPRVDKEGHEFFYIYPRSEAVKFKYIKSTETVAVVPTFREPTKLRRYEEEAYVFSMVQPAVKKLLELRGILENQPIRMLVTVRTNTAAQAVAKLINKWSSKEKWCQPPGNVRVLRAAHITGRDEPNQKADFHSKFSCPTRDDMIDIGVQCKLLGEGYDNRWIAVSVFVSPAKSVMPLSQTHGRAVRKLQDGDLSNKGEPTAMRSFLYYPDETDPKTGKHEARLIVDAYIAGEDEKTDSLFAPPVYKNLKDAHIKLGKSDTEDFVLEMKDNYAAYHAMYEEKRESWEPVCAVQLAKDLYDSLIGPSGNVNVSIIDFGCGIDGLFEEEMSQLLSTREDSGKVTALAVDVVELGSAARWTRSGAQPKEGIDNKHTSFVCKTLAADYSDYEVVKDGYKAQFPPPFEFIPFDAGVFCLSFMAADSLSRGLLAASMLVKPAGSIYIVLDLWKFGIPPSTNKDKIHELLEVWKAFFFKKTGFVVLTAKVKGKPPFVYLTILNVTLDGVDGLETKLGSIRMKDLVVGGEIKSVAAFIR